MQLSDVDLLKLQTRYMRNDEDVKGFTAALNNQIRKIAGEVDTALIYGAIDDQPEEVLDILAWQFKVDWYNASSDLLTKRKAIKDVLILSRTKGTPAAVQKAIEIYFGDGYVQEWFEYGGTGVPHTFRVITSNESVTSERSAQFIRTLNKVKRLVAKLDSIHITEQTEHNIFFAGIIHDTEFMVINFYLPALDSSAQINTSYSINDTRTFDDQDGVEKLVDYLFGMSEVNIL